MTRSTLFPDQLRRVVVGTLIPIIVLALAACSSSASTAPSAGASAEPSAAASAPAAGGTDVTIENSTLPEVSAAVGDTVTWTNADSLPHTVTADDGSFDGDVAAGGTFSQAFATAGTFAYHCEIHPSMTGTITIS